MDQQMDDTVMSAPPVASSSAESDSAPKEMQNDHMPDVPAAASDSSSSLPSALSGDLSISDVVAELQQLRLELPAPILSACQASDIRFSEVVEQPQFIVVSGAAGAGKSTLIEAVTEQLELLC